MRSLKDPDTGRTYWKCTQCNYFNKSAKSSKYKVERHVMRHHVGKPKLNEYKTETIEQDEQYMMEQESVGFDDDFLAAEMLEQSGGYESEPDVKPDVEDLDEKMNKGGWDWNTSAGETRTEDGTLISNDIADYAKVECQLCGTQDPMSTFRKEHLPRAHNMSIVDYKRQFGRKLKMVEKVLHRCVICQELVTHDMDSIGVHLKKPGHNISHKNYNMAYLVDTRSQKRKSKSFYQNVYQPFHETDLKHDPGNQATTHDMSNDAGDEVEFEEEESFSRQDDDSMLLEEPDNLANNRDIDDVDPIEGHDIGRIYEVEEMRRENQNKRHSEQVSIDVSTPGVIESIQAGPPFVCVVPSCEGKSYPAANSLKRHYFNHDPEMYSTWVCPECNFLQPEDHMGKMVKHIMEEHDKKREWAREHAILDTSQKLREFKAATYIYKGSTNYVRRKSRFEKMKISIEDPLVLGSFATGGVGGVWSCGLLDCEFTCDSCYDLKTHYRSHANNLNNEAFECNYCGTTSKTVEKMVNHMQQEHPDTLFLLDYGKSQFKKLDGNSWEDFLEAVKDVLATNPNYVDGRGRHKKVEGIINVQVVNERCSLCNEAFNTLEAFEDHRKVHQPDLIKFKCEQCGEGFVIKTVFENHVRSHSVLFDTLDQGFYRCNGCSLRFDNVKVVKKHLSARHGNLLENCDFCEHCSDFFTSKALLKQHMFKHAAHVFKCPNCPKKRFLTNEELEEHMSSTKCSSKEYAVCPQCGKVCSHMVNLKKHIRDSHGKGHKFQCKICHSFFSSMKLMKQHLQKAHKIQKDYYNFYSKEEAGPVDGDEMSKTEKIKVSKKYMKVHADYSFENVGTSAGYMFPFPT